MYVVSQCGGERYNLVVACHSQEPPAWSVPKGSRNKMQCYVEGICGRACPLIDLPKHCQRRATADREPMGQCTFGGLIPPVTGDTHE